MTSENFARAWKGFSERQPFRPFTLELASGSRIEINHPEAVTFDEELIICKATRGIRSVIECASVVRFIDATGIS